MTANYQTDYAYRILIFLQWHPGQRVELGEIAKTFQLSQNHLTKVSQKLVQIGLIHSVRGRGGGIELAEGALDYGLGDLMRRIEGDHELVPCQGNKTLSPCCIAQSCQLRGFFSDAKDAFYANLNQHTVADLKTKQP